MAALPRAIALLLLSYFRVFPGMGSFMLVGLACVGGAMATGDATQRFVWMAAAASFLVAVPALFAGTHFRGLASRRSHARLPGFTSAMSCAAIGLFLLLSMGSALLMQLQSEPSSLFAMGSLAFAGWSSLFWFGFLPNIMRALLGFASIAALLRWPGSMPDLSAALEWNDAKYGWVTASACGWLIFATWFGRRMRQYRTFERVELAHWNLPMGLRWGTSERVGSPAGTLLLGIGDAPSARAARAVFGVLLVPGALLGMLSAMLPTELVRDWIGDLDRFAGQVASRLGQGMIMGRGEVDYPRLLAALKINGPKARARAFQVLHRIRLAQQTGGVHELVSRCFTVDSRDYPFRQGKRVKCTGWDDLFPLLRSTAGTLERMMRVVDRKGYLARPLLPTGGHRLSLLGGGRTWSEAHSGHGMRDEHDAGVAPEAPSHGAGAIGITREDAAG